MHWQGSGKKVMLALRHQVILNATGRSLCKGFSCSMLLSSGIFSWDEGDQEQQISVKESCVSSCLAHAVCLFVKCVKLFPLQVGQDTLVMKFCVSQNPIFLFLIYRHQGCVHPYCSFQNLIFPVTWEYKSARKLHGQSWVQWDCHC